MSEDNCFYHFNKKAIAKCTDCGKYLCIECKQLMYKGRGRYHITQEGCPECSLESVKKMYAPAIFIILVIFMVILTIIGSVLGGIITFVIVFVSVLLLIILLYFTFIVQGKKAIQKAEKIKKNALRDKSLGMS